MKLKRIVVIALMLYAAVVVQVAGASTIHKVSGLTLGVSGGSDSDLTSGTAASMSAWGQRAQSVGTQTVRLPVSWSQIAPATRPAGFDPADPASPGYNWASLDAQVKQLTSDGFKVLLTITYAPTWAEGSGIPSYAVPGTWKPNDNQLQQFAKALATRYDGHYDGLPHVTQFQAWNEPNMSEYLAPQYKNANGNCTVKKGYWTGAGAESAGLYRGLLNAFYAGVKSVSSADTVLMAGLAPYSNPNCVSGGLQPDYRTSPVAFARATFCLSGSDRKIKGCNTKSNFDAIDTHPYPPPWSGLGPSWSDSYQLDTAVPDVDRVTAVLHAAQRAGTVRKGNIGAWVTEIAWDTNPPDKTGVSRSKAALWIEQGLYILWKQGVNHVLWWQLGDISKFQTAEWPGASGLFTSSGAAKPGATAFRFPFITNRTGSSSVRAWGRAPVAGTLKIERRSGSKWVTVSSGHVSKDEVFEASIGLRGAGTFRAVVGSSTSLSWNQKG